MTDKKTGNVPSAWADLNELLRDSTEAKALALLEAEKIGKRRIQVLLRCHARFNRLRAVRERSELLKLTGKVH